MLCNLDNGASRAHTHMWNMFVKIKGDDISFSAMCFDGEKSVIHACVQAVQGRE